MKMNFLHKLNSVLTNKDKKYLFYLFIFTIIIAAVEVLGISIIMPFFSLANDFSLAHSNSYYNYGYNLFNFTSEKSFLIAFGIFILCFYLIRVVLNISYVYLIARFINSRYDLIVNKLFNNYLTLPYKKYRKCNTSALTKVIINEAANVTEIFWFALILLSEVLIFLFMYAVLMYVSYEITLVISLIILIVSFFIKVVISERMKFFGTKREEYQKIFYEVLNKSFNNIEMIKLQSSDGPKREFNSASKRYVHTKIMSTFLQQVPRFFFEFIGFSLVVLIVLYSLTDSDTIDNNLLPLVSIFILGLYRILPSITRIFLSYNTILFQYKSLDIIHDDLNLDVEILGNERLSFNKKIELKCISFQYDIPNTLLGSLSLTIDKGDSIAIIGGSGSGKSTLIDIIMGLHRVDSGDIYVDDKKLTDNNIKIWRGHFGYIPQNIYLFAGNIAQNVAFGMEIEEDKVIEVLKKASLWSFLKGQDGLNTIVGEGGVMLSGGQKQRVAIARALYKNPDILVLDEATSALDDVVEAKIMNDIYNITKDKTLIIIAHRLSTIRKCDKVFELKDGKLKNV